MEFLRRGKGWVQADRVIISRLWLQALEPHNAGTSISGGEFNLPNELDIAQVRVRGKPDMQDGR